MPVDIGATARLRPAAPPDIVFAVPAAEDFVGILVIAPSAGKALAQAGEGPAVVRVSGLRRVAPETFGETRGIFVQTLGQDGVRIQEPLEIGIVQPAQLVHVDRTGNGEPDRLIHARPRQLVGHDQPDAIPCVARMQRDMGAVQHPPPRREQIVAPQRPVELALYLADDGFAPDSRHQQVALATRQRQPERRQPRRLRHIDPGKPGLGKRQAIGVQTGDFMDEVGVGFGRRFRLIGHSGAPGRHSEPNMRAAGRQGQQAPTRA